MLPAVKKLMRLGQPDEQLSENLRRALGDLRANLIRYQAGRMSMGELRIDGARVIMELRGREAAAIARQLQGRIHPPLQASIEQASGVQRLIVEDSHEGS